MGLALVPAAAAEIGGLEVARRDDLYRLTLDAHVAAPPAAVWAALTDYPNLHRLSSAVRRSDDLGPDAGGHHLVHTLSHVCVFIFCKNLEHLQRMHPRAPDRLWADSVPEGSDFAYGRMQWDLAAEGRGTRFRLEADLRPAFWVPPILGPLLVGQGLRGYALDALEGLEREALARP